MPGTNTQFIKTDFLQNAKCSVGVRLLLRLYKSSSYYVNLVFIALCKEKLFILPLLPAVRSECSTSCRAAPCSWWGVTVMLKDTSARWTLADRGLEPVSSICRTDSPFATPPHFPEFKQSCRNWARHLIRLWVTDVLKFLLSHRKFSKRSSPHTWPQTLQWFLKEWRMQLWKEDLQSETKSSGTLRGWNKRISHRSKLKINK